MEQPGTSSNESDQNFREFVEMMTEINMRPEEFLKILHDGLVSHKKLKSTIKSIKQVKKDIITMLKIQRVEMKNLEELPRQTAILQEEAHVIKREIKKLEPILKIQEDRKKELEQNKESNMLIQREKQFPLHVETTGMNKDQLKEKLESQKKLIVQKENELVQLTSLIFNVSEKKRELYSEKIRLLSAIKLKEEAVKNIREKRKESEKAIEMKMNKNTSSKSDNNKSSASSSSLSSPVVLDIPQICTRRRQRNESTSTCASTQSFATSKKKNEMVRAPSTKKQKKR